MHVEIEAVGIGVPVDFDVRAGRIGGEILTAVVLPLPYRLRHQRERRHHKENDLAFARQRLGDAQSGERLASAAGHDELAAIGRRQTVLNGLQRLSLMVAQFLLRGETDGVGANKLGPVDPAAARCSVD